MTPGEKLRASLVNLRAPDVMERQTQGGNDG
ncbi:hypothetical protein LCGC14_0441500 [marine sediment metagenome]|uniref:Uncharacterized protein n=1 Tax=marine sediment metagenome TaxID=412755 RepID=A0A0F9VUK6_9ZZZZ